MYNIKYIEHPMHLIPHRSRTFHKTKAILLQIVLNPYRLVQINSYY